MKKILRYFLRFFLWTLLLAFLVYCWLFFPSITGYVAKTTCSAVFVSHRDPAGIEKKDFYFPFNLASARVDYRDSAVTASILWMASRKAVYRKGLGATLLSGVTAEQLRRQSIDLPVPPAVWQDTVDGQLLRRPQPPGLRRGVWSAVVAQHPPGGPGRLAEVTQCPGRLLFLPGL